MKSIDLKCNNCGATLTKIETDENTYICTHCGNKQIIKEEKKVNENNYVINQNITKNIYGNDKSEYMELIAKAETYIKLEDYKKAIEVAKKAVDDNPANYLGWWILTKAKILHNKKSQTKTSIITNFKLLKYEEDYKKALKLANEEETNIINEEYAELTKHLDIADLVESKDINNIPANMGKKRKVHEFLLLFIMSTLLSVTLFTGIILSKETSQVAIILPSISLVFSIFTFGLWIQDIKFVKFIEQKDKVTVQELMNFSKINNKNYTLRRILRLINNNNLIGYELVKGEYLIKRK